MSLLIAFLTFILVVTCLLLILLVLVQLPKKEAGAGLAFGGGASDALFGAGGGNALTKMTKYAATVFLVLGLVLAVLNVRRHDSTSRTVQEELSRRQAAGAVAPAATPQVPATQTAPQTGTLQPVQNPSTGPLTIPANPTAQQTQTAPAGEAPAPANTTPPADATPAQPQPQP